MGATSAHFSDEELQCHGTKCGPLGTGCRVNGCTEALVTALEAFRTEAMKHMFFILAPGEAFPGVIVNDAYRCPQHNAEVGGVKGSQHMLGEAADIRIPGMTAAQLEAIARQVLAIKGIGRSTPPMDYIHVDVREVPAEWAYNAEGKQITYFRPERS